MEPQERINKGFRKGVLGENPFPKGFPPKTEDIATNQGITVVVQLVSRMMCPFITMFGLSLILHGHLTPGGGFQGGVVIAASFILFGLAFNRHSVRSLLPCFTLKCGAAIGIAIYIMVGLTGVLLGYPLLANKIAGIVPQGMLGELLSGGTIFWINLGVGLSVGSIGTELFYAFLEEEPSVSCLTNRKRSPYQRRWSDVDKDDSVQN